MREILPPPGYDGDWPPPLPSPPRERLVFEGFRPGPKDFLICLLAVLLGIALGLLAS
jgi:hypothetical protein